MPELISVWFNTEIKAYKFSEVQCVIISVRCLFSWPDAPQAPVANAVSLCLFTCNMVAGVRL